MRLFNRKKNKTKIEVEENVLTLYLGLKALLEQSPALPEEYLIEGYNFLTKIKELSGIDNDLKDDDLVDYKYTFNAIYEKNNKIKSDK